MPSDAGRAGVLKNTDNILAEAPAVEALKAATLVFELLNVTAVYVWPLNVQVPLPGWVDGVEVHDASSMRLEMIGPESSLFMYPVFSFG